MTDEAKRPSDPTMQSVKAPMPEGKPTVNLPAMTDRALLEDVSRVCRGLATTVVTLVEDTKGLGVRMGSVEGRLSRLETPSNPPPPPLTSERVRTIAAQPSQLDLEMQAKLAQALMQLEDEKAKVAALEANAATKDDVRKITESQTAALVGHFDAARKSPAVRIGIAIVTSILATYAATKGIHLQ